MQSQKVMIRDRYDVALESFELPDAPGPGELLVRTRVSFVSAGAELAVYTGLDPTLRPGGAKQYPWKPGFANVADVVAVGEGVSDYAAGDRVFCMAGHTGADIVRADGSELLAKAPEDLDDEVAAATRIANVAVTSVQVSEVQLNDWVVVFGLGLVGNLACQFHLLRGAQVIGVDPFSPRRDLAERVGVEHVLGGSPREVTERIRKLTGDAGAHVAIDATGDLRVIRQALGCVRPFGELVLLGSPRQSVEGDLAALAGPVHYDWITLKGALAHRLPVTPQPGMAHSLLGNLLTNFDLVRRGRLQLRDLISHRVRPGDLKQAYEGLLNHKDQFWGVVVDWRDQG